MRLLFVVVMSVILMIWDHQQQRLSSIRVGLMTLLVPIEQILTLPADFIARVSLHFSTKRFLMEENKLLRDELLIRRVQTQRLVALESENTRLRKLLGSVQKTAGRRLVAEILSVDSDPFRHVFTINKGSSDGVYQGQAVLDAYGVLGQIIQLSAFTSRILLLSDPNHAIPVKVDRSGVRTIAVGMGDGQRLSLEHVPHTMDIREGDILISSGLGQTYPEGYPVGEVLAVFHDPGEAFARIDVLATARFSRSGHVVLVWPESTSPAVKSSTKE